MKLVSIPANPAPDDVVTGAIQTPDGVNLRFARWAPPPGRKGTVLVLQGRAEFIEKYFETVRDLRARGFAVVTFDWRGQGLSDRALSNRHKGYVRSFSNYITDLEAVMEQVVLPDCPPPIFALAHSMKRRAPATSCLPVEVNGPVIGTIKPTLTASWPKLGVAMASAAAIRPTVQTREMIMSLALALDEVGNDLLFALSRRLQDRIVAEARRHGLSAAGELRAGDPGLPLQAQAAVHRLCGGDEIGVRVTEGQVLHPLKSVSMLLGIGIDLPPATWSRCDDCPSAEKCRMSGRAVTPALV